MQLRGYFVDDKGHFVGDKTLTVWKIRDEMGVHFYKVATYGKKSDLFKGARG
jgi:hypothetical protein